MCGGGGNTETRTIVQRTDSEIPEWVKKAGEEQYKKAETLADREYPVYDGPRIAGFTPEQQKAFAATGQAQGAWQPYLDKSAAAIESSRAPVSEADIAGYMNPYTSTVIDSVLDRIYRQAGRDTTQRHGEMAQRGSYLNEDRRAVIDSLNAEATARAAAEAAGTLQMGAYKDAVEQANAARSRDAAASAAYREMAPVASNLGYADIAALMNVGEQQQGQEQQNLALAYEDFLRQFYYPQEQVNYVQSIVQGVPYSSSQTQTGDQVVPVANSFAQNVGAFGALAGGLGMLV